MERFYDHASQLKWLQWDCSITVKDMCSAIALPVKFFYNQLTYNATLHQLLTAISFAHSLYMTMQDTQHKTR